MAYTAVYASTDISAVTTDIIVGVGAALVTFVTLIGLVLLWRFLSGKKLM